MKKKYLAIILIFFLCSSSVYSEDNETTQRIKEYEQKLVDIRQQKNTLSSQIQLMDTQIKLTELKIQETEEKIVSTEKEIEDINSRIQGLDTSLDYLSKTLLKRVVDGYKKRSVSLFNIFLDSDNANDLINRVKYQKTAQENNQKLIIKVQELKNNFEEQKQKREDKKIELDNLNKTLSDQKNTLDNQKLQKQKLLIDTQNSEKVYENLLTEARAQLSALSSFAKSSGAYSVIGENGLGTGYDGNYFSQRDSRWAYHVLGNSSYDCDGHPCTILEAGCLTSSIAMALKKKGIDINPSVIASNPNYFSANTALMNSSLPNYNRKSISDVDSELQKGNYVIVGINYGSCRSRSDHFVVLIQKDGNDYKMYDPLHGYKETFYSRYSQICYSEILEQKN